MFIGRTSELKVLEDTYRKPGFQMTVIYGRRRIGKSRLITEFIKDKRATYYVASQTALENNVRRWSEQFVADLLRAMGYRTTVSPQGGDSGIDITAYKDELPPRILVQVKSGDGDIQETTIQSLKGAMREGDYGLFVTLADYKKNAKKYLESVPIIKGINGTELVDLILRYYDKLSDKYQRMIPLEMVYIPVPREEE